MFFASEKRGLRKWLSAAFHRWDARSQLMAPLQSCQILLRQECHSGDPSEQQLAAKSFSMLRFFRLGE
jgi:hypothetical protein